MTFPELRRAALAAALGLAAAAAAAASPDPARAMLARYGGSYDADALLKEPAVRAELARLLGGEMKHLQRNLSVAGGIGIVGGVLSYDGNADHQGGLEEAVVCVAPSGSLVEAAILSRRTVTVYARARRYDELTQCIKDWITLANSGHADRLQAPRNVRLAAVR